MYQCRNSSKCILINHLFDCSDDCPYSDDETMNFIVNNSNLIEQLNKTYFYCQSSKVYISRSMINNGRCEFTRCQDENLCVSLLTYQLICLNIDKVYDGNLDCIGGTDEPIRLLNSRNNGDLKIYNNRSTS